MNMNIENNWDELTKIVNKSFFSSHYFSVATIADDGAPHLTPIGSLMLVENKKGIMFEKYSVQMGNNIKTNNNICIMGINASLMAILKAVITKNLKDPLGVRLYGTAGERRKATKEEIESLHQRIQSALPIFGRIIRHLSGYKILWGDMKYVRDIEFNKYEYVKFGKMTNSLTIG
jgi:hypothetical protein